MTKPPFIKVLAFTAWLLVAAGGIVIIADYESRAGRFGVTPERWPSQNLISLDPQHDTLVMFAHPQCPCTRASMEELNQLLAQSGGHVAAHVVFFRPAKFPADWAHADLWKTASTISGLAVHEDVDGPVAKHFGAQTSGFVVLYRPDGQLLFHGGITDGRGHVGDNVGKDAIISLLAGREPSATDTPVYGCSLTGDSCPMPAPKTTAAR